MVRHARVGVALACLSVVRAVRKVARKKVGGVAMLNYNYRFLQTSVPQTQQTQQEVEYDWVMKFRAGVGDDKISEFCSSGIACKYQGHAQGVPFATVHCTEEKLAISLSQYASFVEWVEPNSPVDIDDPPKDNTKDNVEMSQTVWSLDAIGVPEAQFTGEGVHIYVMDTGVRSTHNDFGGRAVPTIDTFVGEGVPTECKGDLACATDYHGHGTHVAGTAGGAKYGVAKQAIIHPMKVCCGAFTNILGAMDWLAINKIRPAVMTMSLGDYTTPESDRIAVDAVVASGVTVTFSAGNRNFDSCRKSYSFIASAIAVAASDESNTRVDFSNWGKCNAIFAPGVNILSAGRFSDDDTRVMRGTSMAAPAVAGASALLLQENPLLTADGVRDLLQSRGKRGVINEPKDEDPNLLLWVGL
jgi:subtilisin family serine protease